MSRPARPAIERYKEKLGAAEATGCIYWLANRDKNGYGLFQLNGKTVRVHRYTWIINNGSIPNGLLVLHRCDNPPCQQIEHLFLGTPQDNMTDKLTKGRQNYPGPITPAALSGEANGNHKIVVEEVAEIRTLYGTGAFTQKDLARRFGIGRTQVSRIVNFKRWKED